MTLLNLKKLVSVSALGLVAILGTSIVANAQYDRDDHRNRNDDQRNEREIMKQQRKMDKERAEAQRKYLREEQERQSQWNRRHRNDGVVYNSIIVDTNSNRYRVYRNGSYYNTDNRGAEMLRQAVNSGYQQGFQAGQYDRNNRRRGTWNNNNVYQSGSYGYESSVSQSQYQYYFQQGFQRGYQDGYNSRNQYGSNGTSILGAILGSILDIRGY